MQKSCSQIHGHGYPWQKAIGQKLYVKLIKLHRVAIIPKAASYCLIDVTIILFYLCICLG